MTCLPLFPVTAVLFAMFMAPAQKEAPKAARHDGEPKYDAASAVDLIVTVHESRDVASEPLKGRHLMVSGDKGPLDVFLAPIEFLKFFDLHFASGERIHVIGSITKWDGADVMLAREVRWGTSSLLLRDKQGEPIWKTWMPRK